MISAPYWLSWLIWDCFMSDHIVSCLIGRCAEKRNTNGIMGLLCDWWEKTSQIIVDNKKQWQTTKLGTICWWYFHHFRPRKCVIISGNPEHHICRHQLNKGRRIVDRTTISGRLDPPSCRSETFDKGEQKNVIHADSNLPFNSKHPMTHRINCLGTLFNRINTYWRLPNSKKNEERTLDCLSQTLLKVLTICIYPNTCSSSTTTC